ncbi:hypothetical protein [Burkholderia ambifaria]|uniref:hypothetical protein n=1 Tax=Burkholderia ambifaria TaxID=152480 RepID=UPI003C7DAB8F
MKAHSTAGKWLEWACGGRCRIADVAPIVIRYTGDGASLLMELAVDYQKNNECGDNADFIRYFLIVWLIELKALWGKGLFDFEGRMFMPCVGGLPHCSRKIAAIKCGFRIM